MLFVICSLQMDPDRPVMVPGDKEMARSKKVVKDGGIIYDVVQIRAMVMMFESEEGLVGEICNSGGGQIQFCLEDEKIMNKPYNQRGLEESDEDWKNETYEIEPKINSTHTTADDDAHVLVDLAHDYKTITGDEDLTEGSAKDYDTVVDSDGYIDPDLDIVTNYCHNGFVANTRGTTLCALETVLYVRGVTMTVMTFKVTSVATMTLARSHAAAGGTGSLSQMLARYRRPQLPRYAASFSTRGRPTGARLLNRRGTVSALYFSSAALPAIRRVGPTLPAGGYPCVAFSFRLSTGALLPTKRRYSVEMAASSGVVPLSEVKRFIADCMEKVGTSHQYATDLADLLVEADYRGHYSHGLNRLETYMEDVTSGACQPNVQPTVLKETLSTAWVDGNDGLGVVVGNFCMELAMAKARQTGVGWVVAKGSNHYGIAGWYSIKAVQCGLLGMSFTNTSPLMCPTGAKLAALGTNPLTLAAPAQNGDSFVLDMATTAVAVGKIEVQRRKNESIPENWALGPDGRVTTDVDVAFNTGCLLPLGGTEQSSGYKGYGLGLLVETFCGILGGSLYGPNVRRWMQTSSGDKVNLGQCFIAVDPECFAPGFQGRMSDLLGYLRGMEPSDPEKPVQVPGDPERKHMKSVDEQGGISYHQNQLKASAELAEKLEIRPMATK
uniref:Malate dehydrogenase n=2 Tax=Timema TaxID=61471 RepID=A0A7R9FZQ8_TIMSH|nr:unnamed protein product [Timema shepardi]